jgi:ABC-type nitrate/sulfonate/bicarbonate transport system substrate-binding protein
VMTGQVDIGFAAPPMGLKQVEEGAIRIVGRASDIPSTRDQTVRAIIVNENKLAKAPQLTGKFVQAYAETVDWMYSDPAALKEYERYSGTPERLTRRVMTEFYSKEMLDPYRMSGLPALMDDAVAFKFLKERLNDAQLKELIQVPQRPRMN